MTTYDDPNAPRGCSVTVDINGPGGLAAFARQQARRIEELEKVNAVFAQLWAAEVKAVVRLKQVVGWYAELSNWLPPGEEAPVTQDGGYRARAVLATLDEPSAATGGNK
jgi:hypothetical protein